MTDSERDRLDDLKARLDLPGMKQVSVQEVRDALEACDAEIARLREAIAQERAARERAEAALERINEDMRGLYFRLSEKNGGSHDQ
jgi:outer membrane protein TolC